MKCLQEDCKNEFESKTGRRKFCSDSCKMKHFRKHGKKDTVTKTDLVFLYNEFKSAIQNLAGSVNYGVNPVLAQSKQNVFDGSLSDRVKHDEMGQWQEAEPLSFEKMKAELRHIDSLPTFQELLNGMSRLQFGDEKEEYAEKINQATHLSEKQRKLLLGNLWAK